LIWQAGKGLRPVDPHKRRQSQNREESEMSNMEEQRKQEAHKADLALKQYALYALKAFVFIFIIIPMFIGFFIGIAPFLANAGIL
jgi:uncharacterized protein YqhQ